MRLMPLRGLSAIFSKMLAATSFMISLLGATLPDPYQVLQLTKPPTNTKMAAFSLPTLDGQMINSKNLRGKVILLNFWATWCGPCKDEMPALNTLLKQFAPDHFQMFAVTADIQPQAIVQFWDYLDLGIPVLLDEEGELSQHMMVRNLPTTILIGPDGSIVGRAMGPRKWDGQAAKAIITSLIQSVKE